MVALCTGFQGCHSVIRLMPGRRRASQSRQGGTSKAVKWALNAVELVWEIPLLMGLKAVRSRL